MCRSIAFASVVAAVCWLPVHVCADNFDAFDQQTRASDIEQHFHHDGGDNSSRPADLIDRTLQHGADPLQSNFGYGRFLNNNGVQNYYSTLDYLNHGYGTGIYGNGLSPDLWYYQNRRYISPNGGLYRYPSDRYFTR